MFHLEAQRRGGVRDDPREAAWVHVLEDWADESFLYYFQRWTGLAQDRAVETEKRRPSSPLLRLAAWLRAGGTWERPHTAILRSIDDRLGNLVNFLGSRRFFYADTPSIADLAVYGMLLTMRRPSVAMPPATTHSGTTKLAPVSLR